jgi:hypothetical protein
LDCDVERRRVDTPRLRTSHECSDAIGVVLRAPTRIEQRRNRRTLKAEPIDVGLESRELLCGRVTAECGVSLELCERGLHRRRPLRDAIITIEIRSDAGVGGAQFLFQRRA